MLRRYDSEVADEYVIEAHGIIAETLWRWPQLAD